MSEGMLRCLPTILTLAILFTSDVFGEAWPAELKLGLLLPPAVWNTALLLSDAHRRQTLISLR